MLRRLVIATTSLVIVLGAFSLVSPAFGGPSLGRMASSALGLARQADGRSKTALKIATAGPRMWYVSQEVSVAPQAFKTAAVRCPVNYLVTGSAMVNGAITPIGQTVAASAVLFDGYNPSTSQTFSYTAEVNCVRSAGFNTTTVPQARAAAAGQAQAERAFRASLLRSR
jgi:hypothetical protein